MKPQRVATQSSLLFVMAIALTGATRLAFAQGSKTKKSAAAPAVIVASVVERSIKTGHRSVGTVMPIRRTTVGSAVDGRVLKHNVNQGDPVTQGQVLAQLRTESLQIQLRAAQAETRLRKQELAELQNGSRPEEIAEARARFSAAEVVRSNATAKHKRALALFAKNAINQVDLDDAQERFDAAHQGYLAAQAMLSRIEAGPRSEQIAQAQARLELQEARTDEIEDRIAKYTIKSPFSGFISKEHTEVGAWISQGDAIVEVIQLDVVEVHAYVPAKHAVQLQSGVSVRLEFPELKNQLFEGHVTRVVPTANLQTRTFPVNIRVPNRLLADGRPLLMAGMLAQMELPTGTRARMPLVPKDALVLNGSSRSVFVVDLPKTTRSNPKSLSGGTGIVRAVPVRLGISDDSLIQVEGDLRADQLVVIRGNERLKDGQKILFTRDTASASAASPE